MHKHPLMLYLIANGAHIVELLQLLCTGLGQRRYLVDSRSALHEHAPSRSRLAPNIEIGMDAHHECSNCAAYAR